MYLRTGAGIARVDGLDAVLSERKAQGRNLNQLTTQAKMGRLTVLRSDELIGKYADLCAAHGLRVLEKLEKYRVERCCYGHLHGPAIRRALEEERKGTVFSLISADYLGFAPKKICE